MRNSKQAWVLVAAIASLGMGCGDDADSSNGGSGGKGGKGGADPDGGGQGGAGGGGSGELCVNTGEENLNCPEMEPLTGPCAPKGECCHRSSNLEKAKMLGPDEPSVLEFRVQYSITKNHPGTIGISLLDIKATERTDQEEQSLLWRFEGPRKDGEEISGPGKATLGTGRYNCDGTYSFYSDKAAPPIDGVSDNAARWQAREVVTEVDVTKEDQDRIHVLFASNANRRTNYTPYVVQQDFSYEWELVNQGFNILRSDTSEGTRDCAGKRLPGGKWETTGTFEVYTPLADNNLQTVLAVSQKYCQLVAFGVLEEGMKGLDCTTHERCGPNLDFVQADCNGKTAADDPACCRWRKLPDSLCPVTEEEKTMWGCHLGAEGNVNSESGYPTELNCTATAPTEVLDPDKGAMSVGQCCDPMGVSASLPPCNSYRLLQDFTLAAAEITDEPADELQPMCSSL